MFKNYLKIAIRNLSRHRLFTGLNVIGLATGMTCSLLIFLWVQDERSYDKFNNDPDKIFRLTGEVAGVKAAVVPPPFAAAIKTEIPAISNATRIAPCREMITVGTQKFDEKNIFYADTNFLQLFNYPLIEGNAATVLSRPDAVVLTEATAIKYFGSAGNAMGKPIYIDDDIKGTNLAVTGILKNIPSNSHLQFDMLIPMGMYDRINNPDDSWTNFDVYVYFKLAGKTSPSPATLKQVTQQVNAIAAKKIEFKCSLAIQPLTDIHLRSNFMLDVDGQGNQQHVSIFTLVAVFILLIACINFMNLSTALSSQRAKEVGLRKTIGAQRIHLILQFIGESVLVSFISLLIAIALVIVLLPLFNELASKSISLDLLNAKIIITLLTIAIAVGVLSGSYPAFFLSSFNPVKVLKGVKVLHNGKSFFRNGLVVAQFSISLVLMISTIVVYKQLQFIRNRDMGFNKENLLYVHMPEVGDLKNNRDALVAALKQQPGIANYTITDLLPTYLTSGFGLQWPTKQADEQVIAYRLRIDENFMTTFGMQMATGRFFSKDLQSDDSAYVVNEAAVKVMHLTAATAIGQPITANDRKGVIIGVVKDFNFKPIQQPVEPLVMRRDFRSGYLVVRTAPGTVPNTIASMKNVFAQVYGNYPFSFGFVDDDLQKLYHAEQQMGKLFNVFSILSIIISCLGLFGLATFATQKRIKEIGVRKVLGASEAGIVGMLSKDFIRLVIVAQVIAFPAAWWAMNRWLDNFAYRIHTSWWMFALAGLIALIIAFATVSYQSIKAAVTNPVKSLRTE